VPASRTRPGFLKALRVVFGVLVAVTIWRLGGVVAEGVAFAVVLAWHRIRQRVRVSR
jgi:hypothetical protein